VIKKVKVGKTCLNQQSNGHFTFKFSETGKKERDFFYNWCMPDSEERKEIDQEKAEVQISCEEDLWKCQILKSDYGSDNSADCLPPTPLWNLKEINLCKNYAQNPLLSLFLSSFLILRFRNLIAEAASVDGITKPYAYFGFPNSSFPLHREDLDLCSVNYLHHGEPK